MREMHDKDRLLEWCCLRIDGYSYREIAEQYGVSFQAVQNAINRNIVNVTRKPKKSFILSFQIGCRKTMSM